MLYNLIGNTEKQEPSLQGFYEAMITKEKIIIILNYKFFC